MAHNWFKWFQWTRPGEEKLPEDEDLLAGEIREEEPPQITRTYVGDWSDQFYEVTLHLTAMDHATQAVRQIILPLTVPNYHLSTIVDLLASNLISHTIRPIDQADIQGGESDV